MEVIVETPMGSRQKYAFDERTQQFIIRKVLPAGMAFPFNFGFVPATRGEDGDPLDVIILSEVIYSTGAHVKCRIIGCLPAQQTKDERTIRNDRFVAVDESCVGYAHLQNIDQMEKSDIAEIEAFFIAYLAPEGKKIVFLPSLASGPAIELLKGSTGG